MKFSLLLLMAASLQLAQAQDYLISQEHTPVSGVNAYGYKIAPNLSIGTPALAQSDLITWIFPDGQYRQKAVSVNNFSVVAGTDTVQWRPYANAPTGPNDIQTYVARKGGTGNPPPAYAAFSGGLTATAPEPYYFPPGKTWQISRSWDFSPNNETFLIFSYKPQNLPLCNPGTDGVELTFNPAQLELVQNFAFNNEMLTAQPGAGKIDARILNLNNGLNNQHVFLKLKSKTQIREPILIQAIGRVCTQLPDTVMLRYETAGEPHDPNKKTVDIETICPGQPAVQLTYTVRFHNDGNAKVDQVDVTDVLVSDLQAQTFSPGNIPDPSGATTYTWPAPSATSTKTVKFNNLGLPGINQTNPTYNYDQTNYEFSFTVLTKPNVSTAFDNETDIVFYGSIGPLANIKTNIATVLVSDVPDCYVGTSEESGLNGEVTIAPNPCTDHIEIRFDMAESGRLVVDIRDMAGKVLQTIASGDFPAGPQQFTWEAPEAPAGIYLAGVRTGKGGVVRKVLKFR